MEPQATGSGALDWLAVWRESYDRERAQAEQRRPVEGNDCWAGQAKRFASAAQRQRQPDAFMRFLLPRLQPSDTLIDIGAGSGRHSHFLAEHVANLIAIEPSSAMRAEFIQNQPLHLRERIDLLATGWPEVAVRPAEVIIAAHVLYGVREIGPFLQRMADLARRGCYLLLAASPPGAFISPFWERLYGEPRHSLPGALECLAALHQLGIPANFTIIERGRTISFADRAEARADLRWRLRLSDDDSANDLLETAIDDLLEINADGTLTVRTPPAYVAVVWWEHES